MPEDSSPFLQACRREVPAVRPIWLMRQAGRILKPYRDLRERAGSILTLFKTPELATAVTLMPVELLGVDAAILFADILTPVEPMGCQIDFRPGPVFARPVRTRADVEVLRLIEPEADLPFVLETVRQVRRALPAGVPLIGFAGAPFTLAAYAVEGGGAKDFVQVRRLLHAEPDALHLLLDKLTEVGIAYLRAQVRAGAQAVQVFDTWIGMLSAPEFARLALPYLQRLFAGLADLGVPRIYFAHGAAHFIDQLGLVGAEVLSLDWRVDLAAAYAAGDGRYAVQGNLDPAGLLAPPAAIAQAARRILASTAGLPHVFNLGHGVLPETPADHVRHLVDTVHEYRSAS